MSGGPRQKRGEKDMLAHDDGDDKSDSAASTQGGLDSKVAPWIVELLPKTEVQLKYRNHKTGLMIPSRPPFCVLGDLRMYMCGSGSGSAAVAKAVGR